MPVRDSATLKGYFNKGDVPSESNYVDLIDTIFANGGSATRQGVLFNPGEQVATQIPLSVPNLTGAERTISRVQLNIDKGPIGSDLIVDVHLDGVTIFTNQAHRPRIIDGNISGFTTTIDIPAWTSGALLTFEVDQVGSSTPGSDLTISLVCD